MNGATTVTTTRRFGPTPQADALRAQGRCFLISGIFLVVIGVILIIVTTVTVTFVVGPAVVVLIWGAICIVVGWKRLNYANTLGGNPNAANNSGYTVTARTTTSAINHPPVTVYQMSTVTHGFAQMPPTQYSAPPGTNPVSMYPNECPPYPTNGMYPPQTQAGAPPSYEDATKPQ